MNRSHLLQPLKKLEFFLFLNEVKMTSPAQTKLIPIKTSAVECITRKRSSCTPYIGVSRYRLSILLAKPILPVWLCLK